MEIQLSRFNMDDIKDDKVVVLIGKRETGKSFLCKDILYHHSSIPVKSYQGQKQQMNFIVKWYQNYLFMKNINLRLLQIF